MRYDKNTKKLTPEEGMWLTQAELSDENVRTFSPFAYLPKESDKYIFTEWTEEQKQEWEREHPQPEPQENK